VTSPSSQELESEELDPARTDAASEGEQERRRITGRAAIVALGTLASRVLGLGRDLVLAALFTRAATDAFLVAFQIPNLLRQLLAEGAVQTSVLPVLAKTREQDGEAAARAYFRAIRGLSLATLAVVTALGMIFASDLVDLFAAGFRQQPGQHERAVELTRWVFPYIFFMGTAALGVAALNTHKRFVVTSFAPALLNVAFIAFALGLSGWLANRGRDPILAMAMGALVGGVLQMVAQWPSLRAIGYLQPPSLAWNDPRIRETLRRLGPTLLGVGVYYIDVVVGRRLLSELGEGPISYFGFALRLCDFPQGIFVMALQTATLPSLAVLVAKEDLEEVAKTSAFGLRLALFVGIGATALFVVLAEPIVAFLFQRGEFGPVATRETARALMAQGLGIWTVAVVRQLVSVYFALGDTRTPVWVAAADLCVFVGLAVALRGPLGHVGISLAVTGAGLAQMSLLWWRLRRRLPRLHGAEIVQSALRSTAAAAGGVAFGWITARWLTDQGLVARGEALGGVGGELLKALPALLGSFAFVLGFLGCAALVRSPELATIGGPVLRRLRSSRTRKP
jgi:putative peptidoglycan lipid II flippase